VPDHAHEAALLHARAYEQRRAAGRLPGVANAPVIPPV
jgi:hypothetical protein